MLEQGSPWPTSGQVHCSSAIRVPALTFLASHAFKCSFRVTFSCMLSMHYEYFIRNTIIITEWYLNVMWESMINVIYEINTYRGKNIFVMYSLYYYTELLYKIRINSSDSISQRDHKKIIKFNFIQEKIIFL